MPTREQSRHFDGQHSGLKACSGERCVTVNPPASLDTKRVSGGLRSRALFLALEDEEEQKPRLSAKALGVEGNSGRSQTQSLPCRQERSNAIFGSR